MLKFGALAVASGLFVCTASSAAMACDADEMLRTKDGFIFKVVGGSDKIEATKAPDGAEKVFTLDLMQPYYVICEDGDYYRVSDLPAQTVDEALTGKTGYVKKDQIYNWPTREALNFSPLVWGGDRPEIVAWDDDVVLEKFLQTGDAKANPPAFREDRDGTLKRERALQPYPVLSSEVKKMRETVEKRVFDVLLPAELPAEATVVIDDKSGDVTQKLTDALVGGTFAIAFDATGSMADFALDAANDIKTAFESLPQDVQDKVTVGFVFYRDKDDDEKMFVVKPLPVKDAMNALIDAAKSGAMHGGGDAPEPVLDAVYYAATKFPWKGDGGQGGGGSRIILAVLSDDAKPTTMGEISDDVPAGIDAATLANQLATSAIQTITVQAGPASGDYLASVLGTLAEGTGGQFIEWGSGGDDRRKAVTQAVANELAKVGTEAVDEGKDAISSIVIDYEGYPTLLLKTLDGDKLNALREAGIKFNINPGENAVLVRPGFMLENPDLLQPQIQIEKDTLDALINLFSVLAATGVDADAMIESAGEAIAAIAGEDYDKDAPISDLVKKRLGINFRSPLLEFNLEYLAGMVPAERLALQKRIQEAADKLSKYRDGNLEAFNTSPAVWMPVAELP